MRYDFRSIEQKWKERWAAERSWAAREDSGKPKWYGLIEFPYPSGEGLHVGHLRSYTAMDVIARKRRMEGFEVLYPVGWDAFGLPAENYALKTGQHPRVTTEKNCVNFRRQLQAMGFSFDWSREVNTTDPAYYKWTQWIFLQLLKHGLAYKATMPINWCPSCKIGLANEEAVGGVCERCGGPVEKRDKEQWMLKITAYAEKLLAGLEHVDYIEAAKVQQRNWIGRSEGATIHFRVIASEAKQSRPVRIEVFTTRPDTLFGATYLVLAPEHPLVEHLLSPTSSRAERPTGAQPRDLDRDFSTRSSDSLGRNDAGGVLENSDEVRTYIESARRKTDIERTNVEKDKTGVCLNGIRCLNPANGEEIPVWVADYVLAHYGTGAIMAVPAHDERDFAFAKKYGLPIREVIHNPSQPPLTLRGGDAVTIPLLASIGGGTTAIPPLDARGAGGVMIAAYTGDGTLVDSGKFTGMASEDAKRAITEHVGGEMTVTYRIRDWVFSRQRYWGEPIPVVFCAQCATSSSVIASEAKQSRSCSANAGIATPAPGGLAMTVEINGVPHAIVPIPEDQLPVVLPDVERYQPTDTGESPLAAITEWVNTKCPRCGGPARRETDVMPNWAGSSWYFLAYAMHRSLFPSGIASSSSTPRNDSGKWSSSILQHWMPVDWYNGGMEHTTLHLLYSRFWNIFLHDIGVVPVAEPYKKRTSHGLILAADGEKMSKSRGNVVNPDAIIEQFGADAVRVYEMFIGPFDQPVPWSTDGLIGCRRFLEKVSAISAKVASDKAQAANDDEALVHVLHRTVKKVTDDIEAMRFNTAVSALMEYTNVLGKRDPVPFWAYRTLLALLAPFAPHLAEELWECGSASGEKSQIATEPWPTYDPALVVEDEVALVVQVNGKVRATIRVPRDITEDEATARALAEPNVAAHLGTGGATRVVFVPGRILNFVR